MNKSQGKLGKNRMGAMKGKVVLLIVPALFLLGFYAGRREPLRHVVTGGEVYFAPGVQCENRVKFVVLV